MKETRPDATERAPEVPEYTEGGSILPEPSLKKEPPAPRKKPIGVSASDARQLDARSVEVAV